MRFSRAVLDVEQAMSIKFNTMVYDLLRRGERVIIMSLGEAYFDLPLLPMEALPFPESYHYSHSRGLPTLREKVANFFARKYDTPVDPEKEILITAGSKAAIHMTFMSILDPGDEVLLFEPAWVSYTEQIKLCHARAVGIPCDVGVLEAERFVTPRTRAIVVTNPNNPRGKIHTEAELRFLLSLAEKHDLWLLSDEAYSEFAPEGSFVCLGCLDPRKKHGIVFNSISKNYGISGWRLGYVIGNELLIDQVLKVNQHLITCPATILSHYVNTYFDEILQTTAPQIARVMENRRILSSYMEEIGLCRLPGDATFYFLVSISPSRLGSEEFCRRLLEEDHISTVPGIGYGRSCDKFIRVSFGTASMEDNRHGLRRIKALIERTSPGNEGR